MSTLLDEKNLHIESKSEELLPKEEEGKKYYADYIAIVNGDTDIQIEMQNKKVKMDVDRIIHYMARLIDKDITKGQSYHENRKIVIWFHNYKMPENEGLVKDYKLLNSSHYIVKLVNLSILDTLLDKPVDEMSHVERLCLYLRYSHVKKYQPLMKELMKAEKGLEKMEESIQNTISNPRDYFSCQDIREAFERRELEIEIDRQKKLLLKETRKREEEMRKNEEKTRKLEEETRKNEEKQRKIDIANKIIDFMKQGIAFEVAAKLAGQ